MIKGVTFVSREVAESMVPVPDVGMISITDAGDSKAFLRKGWGALLRQRFDDIDYNPSRCYGEARFYIPMSADQAQELLEWVKQNEEKLTGIVVHCEHGQSRSAAVAKFLQERYGLPVDESDVRFHNKHVYRLLSDLSARP